MAERRGAGSSKRERPRAFHGSRRRCQREKETDGDGSPHAARIVGRPDFYVVTATTSATVLNNECTAMHG